MSVINPERERRAKGLRPTSAELIDAGFLAVLVGLALLGFRSTYDGYEFLVVGLAAFVLGVLVAYLTVAWRQPVIVAVAATIVIFYLATPVALFRSSAPWHCLPSLHVITSATSTLVHGWKDMLTTLPPIAESGRLLLAPLLIGLLAGAIGMTVAARIRLSAAPVAVAVLALAATIVLGTAAPSARLLQGAIFGSVALCWTAVRSRRNSAPLRNASGRTTRIVTAVVVVALAGTGSWFASPHLYGWNTSRIVLRNYVSSPFDIGAYPSPLVGFRKYTKQVGPLYNATLFTVRGVPANTPVQIATLDDYNGSVWGASSDTVPAMPGQPLDSFQRVGSHIRTGATGTDATVTVGIQAAYADAPDLSAWLPGVGTFQRTQFDGSRAGTIAGSFRYNLATGSGVVAQRLDAGDRYTVHTVIDQPRLSDTTTAQPGAQPTLDPAQSSFVEGFADRWSGTSNNPVAQAMAIARHLRSVGAYSDGGPGEANFLPGHSLYRLTTFLNSAQIVGDDEQYAATFALVCNYLGVPARVVLEATPVDGVVKGMNVHADVQLFVLEGGRTQWALVDHSQFMPDSSKKPQKTPPRQKSDARAAIVPPPNAGRPPSSLDPDDQSNRNTTRLASHHGGGSGGLPAWLRFLGTWVGLPVLGLLVLAGLIVGVKTLRRTLRRRRGSGATRYATGWRELVDHGRDLGAVVPGGRTRREDARALAAHVSGAPAVPVAVVADAGVFGPGEPGPEQIAEFWRQVDVARKQMSRNVSLGQRIFGGLNLRSFRRARPAAPKAESKPKPIAGRGA